VTTAVPPAIPLSMVPPLRDSIDVNRETAAHRVRGRLGVVPSVLPRQGASQSFVNWLV
jgi:hypothetical protein